MADRMLQGNYRYLTPSDCVKFVVADKQDLDYAAALVARFELLEAYRALPYLKKGGRVIVNARQIDPMPVITGAAVYPPNIADRLSAASDAAIVDALSLSAQAGSARAVNVVLIGRLARDTQIPRERWLDAVRAAVPQKFLDINLRAFELGYNA